MAVYRLTKTAKARKVDMLMSFGRKIIDNLNFTLTFKYLVLDISYFKLDNNTCVV